MKQRKTRFLALLLAVVMVLGLLPGIALPKAEAATPDYAALKTTIQGLKYPLATALNWPVGNAASVDGIYMVVSSQARENTGKDSDKYHTLNPAGPETDGASYVGYAVNKAEADATGYYFTGASRASYSILKGNPTSFTIQSMDMLYWNIEAIGNRTDYAALRLFRKTKGYGPIF